MVKNTAAKIPVPQPKQSDIYEILAQREKQYGDFKEQSRVAQGLKNIMVFAPSWSELEPYQKEALEMTQHKIARILSGDPRYVDSWQDIIGYITLVLERIEEED